MVTGSPDLQALIQLVWKGFLWRRWMNTCKCSCSPSSCKHMHLKTWHYRKILSYRMVSYVTITNVVFFSSNSKGDTYFICYTKILNKIRQMSSCLASCNLLPRLAMLGFLCSFDSWLSDLDSFCNFANHEQIYLSDGCYCQMQRQSVYCEWLWHRVMTCLVKTLMFVDTYPCSLDLFY